jgi:hypothetical protein
VEPAHPFVPEILRDLVDALHPAHDQALEVQLVRDAEIELHVERVVVRDEGAGQRASVDRLQHRGLDLEKPAFVEEAPDRRDHPGTGREHVPDLRRDGQVHVPLPVPGLPVAQPGVDAALAGFGVHLLLPQRQRPDRLGKQLVGVHPIGRLPRSCPEYRSLDADPVADVDQVDQPNTPPHRAC